MADLFSPLAVKDVRLKNRIAVSPMCQYSALDGHANDWHAVTLGARAVGGAGLVVVEATAVSPEGRITPQDLGLWTDAQAESLRPIVRFMAAQGAVPGIQLAHAGRKASANRPWEGDDHIPADAPSGWLPIGPSGTAFGANLPRAPQAMTLDDIARVQADFVSAARRALEVGFEWLELHFAHGYLGQSFFSPLANHRTDAYGGSAANRARFLVETFAAVRAVWPERLPLTIRLGVTDYVAGEQPLEESIALVRQLDGLDLVDVSMGFNTPDVSGVPWKTPGFLAPLAGRIKAETGILAATSWNLSDPVFIDGLIRDGMIDIAMLAKAMLADPHWPCTAARALGRPQPTGLLPVPFAHWLKRF